MQRILAIALLVASGALRMSGVARAQPAYLGPDGARLLCVREDPERPGFLYAAGFAGMFRSTDGGAGWSKAGLGDQDIARVAMGAGGVYAGSFTEGVWQSADGAPPYVRWAPAPPGELVALATQGERLWAGTSAGAYLWDRSTSSWSERTDGLGAVADLLPLGGDSLWAAADNGLFQTTDAGHTWLESKAPPTERWSDLVGSTDGSLYAAATPVDFIGGGVYRSVDGGASWERRSSGLSNPTVVELAVDPEDPATLVAAVRDDLSHFEAGVYLSVDRGAQWRLVAEGLKVRDARSVAPLADGRWVVATAGGPGELGGVYAAGPTWSWSRLGRGLSTVECRALALDPTDGSIWAAMHSDFRRPSGLYRSADLGDTWHLADASLPLGVASVSLANHRTLASVVGTHSGVWIGMHGRWIDAGLTKERVYWSGAETDEAPAAVATDRGLHVFEGQSWNTVTATLGQVTVTAAACTGPAGWVIVVDEADVLETTDGGSSWQIQNAGLPAAPRLALAVTGTGDWVVGTGAGLFVRPPAGVFEAQNQGLPSGPVAAVVATGSKLWVGSATGVYRWHAALATFVPVVESVAVPVAALAVSDRPGLEQVVAAAPEGGAWWIEHAVPVELSAVRWTSGAGWVALDARAWGRVALHVERRFPGQTFERLTHRPLTGAHLRWSDEDARLAPGLALHYRLVAAGGAVAGEYRVVVQGAGKQLRVASLPTQAPVRVDGPPVPGQVRVVDALGRLKLAAAWPASGTWWWDGRDGHGRSLAGGVYWLEWAGVLGRFSTRMVLVR